MNAKILSQSYSADAAKSHSVTAVDDVNKILTIAGDQRADFIHTKIKVLYGSTFLKLTVVDVVLNGSDTDVTVLEDISVLSALDTLVIPVITTPDINFDVSAGMILKEYCLGTGSALDADFYIILDTGVNADDTINIPIANIVFNAEQKIDRKAELRVINYEVSEIDFGLWLKASFEKSFGQSMDTLNTTMQELLKTLGRL